MRVTNARVAAKALAESMEDYLDRDDYMSLFFSGISCETAEKAAVDLVAVKAFMGMMSQSPIQSESDSDDIEEGDLDGFNEMMESDGGLLIMEYIRRMCDCNENYQDDLVEELKEALYKIFAIYYSR